MTNKLLAEWESYLRLGCSPRTVGNYLEVVNRAMQHCGDPEQWTGQALLDYLHGLPVSPASKNTYLQALRAFCNQFRKDLATALPGVIRFAPPQPKVAYIEDIDKLLASKLRPKQRLGLLLVADAGLRESEVRSLTWEQIDWEERSLLVNGKGHKVRVIPIVTERLWEALVAAHEKPRSQYVVPGANGSPMTRGNLSRQLAQISEAVLGKRLPAHSFRHGFAVRAVRSQVPEAIIQRALGHSNLATTDRYLRGLDGNLEAQREGFAKFR